MSPRYQQPTNPIRLIRNKTTNVCSSCRRRRKLSSFPVCCCPGNRVIAYAPGKLASLHRTRLLFTFGYRFVSSVLEGSLQYRARYGGCKSCWVQQQSICAAAAARQHVGERGSIWTSRALCDATNQLISNLQLTAFGRDPLTRPVK